MKNLLSRYCGHAIILSNKVAVKTSAVDKPEDQFF